MLRRHRQRQGYTIMELIVVMAVMTVLAALILPAIQFSREAARRTECLNNVKQLILAHQMYHDSHNRFPNLWAPAFENISSVVTPRQFRCPTYSDSTGDAAELTVYAHNGLLVGEKIAAITDGTSNTVLHGELTFGEHWAGSPLLPSLRCESGHTAGAVYGFADGATRLLSNSTREDTRQSLLIPNDGNVISVP